MSKVLIAGVARSGTTWVGKVLARTAGATYLNEPDNDYELFARRVKRELGPLPVLSPGDRAPGYESLWRNAFGETEVSPLRRGGNRIRGRAVGSLRVGEESAAFSKGLVSSPSLRLRAAEMIAAPRRPRGPYEHVIVKSVHCLLALEWVVERFIPQTLVVRRHPLNVVGSWMELGVKQRDLRLDEDARVGNEFLTRWGVAPPPPGSSELTRVAWHYGLYATALQEACDRHPEWVIVQHEELCEAPEASFEQVAGAVGLPWTDDASAWLAASNRAGEGFATNRIAGDQPQSWKRRLNDAAVAEVAAVLEGFPLRGWPASGEAP